MLQQLMQIGKEAGVERMAIALYDYETDLMWSYRGETWFHAASTIKVAVLLAVFGAIEAGQIKLHSRVHVRNRFLSVVDGEPYKIMQSTDSDPEVYSSIGRTMMVRELANYMITISSNLATNLLIDIVGLEQAKKTIEELKLDGIDLKRGVEDNKAFYTNINNRVTANGLLRLYRLLHEHKMISPEASEQMLDILFQQKFNSGIPAGLPIEVRPSARIAHKTGEISTVAHDSGIVYLSGRKPYVLVILTEWNPETPGHQELIARISKTVYEQVTNGSSS